MLSERLILVDQGYPSDWDSRRKRVYKRDNYECNKCGRKGGPDRYVELHAHHIIPKSKGGSHELSNLQTVCKSCHKEVHSNTDSSTEGSDTSELNSGIPILIQFGLGIGLFSGIYIPSKIGVPEGTLGLLVTLCLWTVITIVCLFGSAIVWGIIFGDIEII